MSIVSVDFTIDVLKSMIADCFVDQNINIVVVNDELSVTEIIDSCEVPPAIYMSCGDIRNIEACSREITSKIEFFFLAITDVCGSGELGAKDICLSIAKALLTKPSMNDNLLVSKTGGNIISLNNRQSRERGLEINALRVVCDVIPKLKVI